MRLTKLIAPSFYELHKEIKKGEHTEYWVKGGRGSTKSSCISIEIILGLIRDPNAHAVVFRLYKSQLRGSVLGQMEWAIHMLGMSHLCTTCVSPMSITINHTGQKIIFLSADSPKKDKGTKLAKGYIKYIWLEEIDEFGGMEAVRTIRQTLVRGTGGKKISFYTYNPPKSSTNWVNKEVKIYKPGRRVHHSDYRDVPVEWLGEDFIAEAEHLKKVNELAYRHEYFGEEVGTGLEVFSNITTREITNDEISQFTQIRQGIDYGYAIDPVTFNRMHYDRKKRRLYVFFEYSGVGISNRKLYDNIKQFARYETIAESAEPKSNDEMRSYGMRIRAVKKGPDSVEFGIKWLQDLEEIIIDPIRCPRANNEFTNYELEVNRQGEVINRFPDKDNHTIDAVRYALSDDIKSKTSKFVRVRGLR